MSLYEQVLLGVIIGTVLGTFSVLSIICSKENSLKVSWVDLTNALEIRYLKLKNVLNFLKKHMEEFSNEITALLLMCDEAIEMNKDITNIKNCLDIENAINCKLEEIKSNMQEYPSIQEDDEIESAILAIAESEAAVGDAIERFNSKNLEYSLLLEAFPISIVGFIFNKKADIIPFSVTDATEFDESYVDEDEI